MKDAVAHIDGDIIAYSVSSACDGKLYRYKGTVFDSKSTLNKILKSDGVDDSAIETFYEPELWDSVRDSIISYTEKIIEAIGTDYKIYLTGKSNFRYDLATILPYKGNRTLLKKPDHLDSVRQFLVDNYDAEVSIGMEADDAIGLAHNPEKDIIATLDKDLNCIPGSHYNWMEDRLFEVDLNDADAAFYKQVITGDPTDNILGIYGLGAKAKVLEYISSAQDEEGMFDLVAKEYKCRFGNYWKQFMLENCRLLWILQKRNPKFEERLKNE